MKKIILVLLLASVFLCSGKSYAEEKVLEYNVSVRMTFGFGSNYDIEKFSKFASKTIRSELSSGYTMYESKGVWHHPDRGIVRENNVILLFDMLDSEENNKAVGNVAEGFIMLFKKGGGSVYVVKTPILEAKVYL